MIFFVFSIIAAENAEAFTVAAGCLSSNFFCVFFTSAPYSYPFLLSEGQAAHFPL